MKNFTPMEADFALEDMYKSLTRNFVLSKDPTSEIKIIDLLTKEVSDMKFKYFQEEELFVNTMLRENPVEKMATKTTLKNGEKMSELQKQKSEACRKSRMNNKIKKAKCKYRHKFITSKLDSSTALLNCIKNMIAHTERKLIGYGLDQNLIFGMKEKMGLQNCKAEMEL